MTDQEYIEKLKSHIYWDEGMDDTMLSTYLQQGKRYVQNATGKEVEYLVIMCTALFYEYRVSEKELEDALNALTPLFIQEVYADAETTDEQT